MEGESGQPAGSWHLAAAHFRSTWYAPLPLSLNRLRWIGLDLFFPSCVPWLLVSRFSSSLICVSRLDAPKINLLLLLRDSALLGIGMVGVDEWVWLVEQYAWIMWSICSLFSVCWMAPDSRDLLPKPASCLLLADMLICRSIAPRCSRGSVSGDTNFGFCWFPVYLFIYLFIYVKQTLDCIVPRYIAYLAYQSVWQNSDCFFYVTRRKRCTITSVALTVHAQLFFSRHTVTEGSAIFFLAPVWCSVG